MNKSKKRKAREEQIMTIAFLATLALCIVGFLVVGVRNNICHDQLRDLAQYSNADHGNTIEEFVRNTGSEEAEYIAIFNLQNEKLFEYTAENDEVVRLPDEVFVRLFGDYHRQDLIAVHNHPGEFETPFSPTDLRTAHSEAPYIEQIVSTRSRVFILRQNKSGWPQSEQINLYLEDIKTQLNNGGLLERFARDQATGYLYANNEFVQDFANTFDLRFDETTVDDFNFADWAP